MPWWQGPTFMELIIIIINIIIIIIIIIIIKIMQDFQNNFVSTIFDEIIY
jgi:hypothetical protein